MQNEMRDRLIKTVKDSLIRNIDKTCELAENIVDDLLANGAILPPCKVGDTVYVAYSVFYAEYKVMEFKYDGIFVWAKLVNEEYEPQDQTILRCIEFELGKTVFLTEKEAQEALRKENEGK